MKFQKHQFKRISSDPNMTVLQHANGHEVKVLHQHISPKMRGELESIPMHESMPKMANGGELALGDDQNVTPGPTPIPISTPSPINPDQPVTQGQSIEEAPVPEVKMPQMNQNDPFGERYLMQGLQQQQAGLQQQAKAESQLGKEEAGVLKQNIEKQDTAMEKFNENTNKMNQAREALTRDVQNEHIDPNHFWANRSTAGKISSVIGMIIGGLGGSDAPLRMLNGLIDRDIDAQKTELGKKTNLLTANHQAFQDLHEATSMTRVMLNDQLGNKLKLAAANTADPMARARLLQAEGQLNSNSAQLVAQIGLKKAILGAQPTSGEDNFNKNLNMVRVMNPAMGKELESRYVPGVGLASNPISEKSRDELIARQNLSSNLAKLENFSRQHSGTVLDRKTINEGAALARNVQDIYRRANAQGVFREAEKDFVEKSIATDPTAFFSKYRTIPGYAETRKINNSSLEALKSGLGIKQFNQGQQAPQSQPRSIVQNGFTYTLNPQTGKYE